MGLCPLSPTFFSSLDGRKLLPVPLGGGKLAGYVLDMGKGDAEKGRVLEGGLSLFLVLGDQQQLVSFV